jgi:hypothetical protein
MRSLYFRKVGTGTHRSVQHNASSKRKCSNKNKILLHTLIANRAHHPSRLYLIIVMNFDQCSGVSEAKIFTGETWLGTKVVYVGS